MKNNLEKIKGNQGLIANGINAILNALPFNDEKSKNAFIEETLAYIRDNNLEKKLEQSDFYKQSFVESVKALAMMNMRLGKHAWLIPFDRKAGKGKDRFAISIKRSGISHFLNLFTTVEIKNIKYGTVFKGDEFSYNSGTEEVEHSYDPLAAGRNSWENIKGAYAIVDYVDGVRKVEILTKEELEQRKSVGASKGGTYDQYPKIMAENKVSKRLISACELRMNLNKTIMPSAIDDKVVDSVDSTGHVKATYDKELIVEAHLAKTKPSIVKTKKPIAKTIMHNETSDLISSPQVQTLLELIKQKGKDPHNILQMLGLKSIFAITENVLVKINKKLNDLPDIVVEPEKPKPTFEPLEKVIDSKKENKDSYLDVDFDKVEL